jgi:DNA polymerase III delta prime subunit
MSSVNKLFTEKYRPSDINNIILLDRVKSALGSDGTSLHYLLVGSPGLGKTTTAKAIAGKHPFLYVNISDESSVEILRQKVADYCDSGMPIGYTGDSKIKIVILDEMDGASPQFYNALRGFMEKPHYVNRIRFIGTANYINKIPDAIQSRFMVLDFNPSNHTERTELLNKQKDVIIKILKQNSIKVEPKVLGNFIKKNFPDMRVVLNAIQHWSNLNKDIITEDDVNSYTSADSDIFTVLVSKPSPIDTYVMLNKNYSNNVDDIFMQLYNVLPKWIRQNKPDLENKLPDVLITIAEFQATRNVVLSPIVSLCACFFKIQKLFNS